MQVYYVCLLVCDANLILILCFRRRAPECDSAPEQPQPAIGRLEPVGAVGAAGDFRHRELERHHRQLRQHHNPAVHRQKVWQRSGESQTCIAAIFIN